MNLEMFNKNDLKDIKKAKQILNNVIFQTRYDLTKKPSSNKIYKNRFNKNAELVYKTFRHELIKNFDEFGFQFNKGNKKALKFFPKNLKYNFNFEIVLAVSNNNEISEITFDKDNYILNQSKTYNFTNLFREANNKDRELLTFIYKEKRENKLMLTNDNINKNFPNFLLLLESCKELMIKNIKVNQQGDIYE